MECRTGVVENDFQSRSFLPEKDFRRVANPVCNSHRIAARFSLSLAHMSRQAAKSCPAGRTYIICSSANTEESLGFNRNLGGTAFAGSTKEQRKLQNHAQHQGHKKGIHRITAELLMANGE